MAAGPTRDRPALVAEHRADGSHRGRDEEQARRLAAHWLIEFDALLTVLAWTSLLTIRRRLDHTILPTLGAYRWNQVERALIQAAVTEWSTQLAPATVRVAYTYLTGICHLAVDERRAPATPCQRINLPVIPDEPVVPLTITQVQALTDAAPARLRPMFVLAAATGLRSGELRGLTWDRISFTSDGGGVVRVDRQLVDAARSFEPVWGRRRRRGRYGTCRWGQRPWRRWGSGARVWCFGRGAGARSRAAALPTPGTLPSRALTASAQEPAGTSCGTSTRRS